MAFDPPVFVSYLQLWGEQDLVKLIAHHDLLGHKADVQQMTNIGARRPEYRSVRWNVTDFMMSVLTCSDDCPTRLYQYLIVYLQISTGIVSSVECRESLEQAQAFFKEYEQ